MEDLFVKKGWNFPNNNNGQIVGISEAGIETFKGSPIVSLAREICQNSLDARKDITKPVTVEFNVDTVNAEDIEYFDELRKALALCKEFWSKNKNYKTVNFFEKACTLANNETICVMRISDYNTTGLTGSREKYNTPWQNLVKSSGVSDKSGSSGGSFGIGKSAPFVCSDFRTVVYSTLDCEGVCASQGVARLVSFENTDESSKKYITQGIGYYGNTKDNSALSEMMSIGNYKRTESGTDLYILGFVRNYNWIDDIINAILDGFLISIINNDLVVRIEEHEINSANLSEYIENYKETSKLAYNYYQVLTADDAVVFTDNFKDMGNVTLKILLNPEFKRRVLVTRKNGMKIFDKGGISSTIYFAGVLVLEDEKVNEYFRDMETPQHDDWQPERHSNPKEAKKYKTELFRWVKNNIIELGRQSVSDETDAQGIGDYLPDEVFIEMNKPNADKVETLESKVKNIEISEMKSIVVKKESQRSNDSKIYGEVEAPGFYDEEETDERATVLGQSASHSIGGLGKMVWGKNDRNSTSKIKNNIYIKPQHMRLYISDYDRGQYTLSFLPEKSAEKSFVKLSFAGEQSNIKIPVKSAHLTKHPELPLKTNVNKILIGRITKNSKISITFEIDYKDACPMEVSLYGTKI